MQQAKINAIPPHDVSIIDTMTILTHAGNLTTALQMVLVDPVGAQGKKLYGQPNIIISFEL